MKMGTAAFFSLSAYQSGSLSAYQSGSLSVYILNIVNLN
jgi:hypothetical protein